MAIVSAVRPIAGLSVAFVVVFLGGLIPILLVKNGLPMAPVWPANGLALILAMRARTQDLPRFSFVLTVVAAILATNLCAGNSVGTSIAFTLGNAAEIATAYAIIHWPGWRRAERGEPLSSYAMLKRLLAASAGGPAIGATVGAIGLSVETSQGFTGLWMNWAASSMLSMLIVSSLGLGIPARARDVLARLWTVGPLLGMLVLAVVSAAPAFLSGRIALLILTAPVITMAAFKFRVIGAASTLAIVAAISLGLAGSADIASRFNAVYSPGELVLLIQVYLVVQGIIALCVAAYLDERDALKTVIRTQKALTERQAEMRLSLLMNVAHEIRTPLNVVQGCGELLDRTGGLNLQQKDLLGALQRAAGQLQDLAVNLLETSRLDSGMVSFEPELIDPADPVREAAALAVAAFGKPDAKVAFDIAEGVRVWADQRRFRQVITNLITNAVRHGGEYGQILVQIKAYDGQMILSVIDRGPGFPIDFAGRLENVGREQPNASNAGVGLSLVRQMVAAHGGDLSISSTPFVSTCVSAGFPDQGSLLAKGAMQLSETVTKAA